MKLVNNMNFKKEIDEITKQAIGELDKVKF